MTNKSRRLSSQSRLGRIGEYPVYRGQMIVLTFDWARALGPGRHRGIPRLWEERRLKRVIAETDNNITQAKDRSGSGPRYRAAPGLRDNEEDRPCRGGEVLGDDPGSQGAGGEGCCCRGESASRHQPLSEESWTTLRVLRASLTPAQLQAQAREGYNSKTPRRPIDITATAGQAGPGVSVGPRQTPTGSG